jgi:hypothetical protein
MMKMTRKSVISSHPPASIAPGTLVVLPSDPLELQLLPNGMIRVVEGARAHQIDLRDDIVGCLGPLFDPTSDERHDGGDRKTVLDATQENGEHFVVLSAEAPANCDIQGKCGGAPLNMTLIWLRIGADLSLKSKQAFAVEDCWQSRGLDGERLDNAEWIEWREKMLSLSLGAFTMRFTEVNADSDVSGNVTYDRRAARHGLQITHAVR